MIRKFIHIVFILIASLMFVLPAWNLVFRTLPDASVHENRKLARFPRLSIHTVENFPADFEKWFSDHFPLRNTLMNGSMYIDIYGLKQSPIPNFVIIGKDNWLYNTGHEIEVYRGINRFTSEELSKMAGNLKRRQQFIKEQGALMLYVVVPVKYSVYPEFLPLNLRKVNAVSRTDQFVDYMTQAGIPVMDLRKVLLNAKCKSFPLFYKSDNHWNYNGGFVAYREIIRYLYKQLPSVGLPLVKSDYSVTTRLNLHGNLSDMLFMKGGCGDTVYTYTRISPNRTLTDTVEVYPIPKNFRFRENYEERYSNGNPHSPKILIIRDSFGGYVAHFLKEHFGETVCIFDAWEYKLNPDIIKKEKPDIVIFMVLESFTDTLLN